MNDQVDTQFKDKKVFKKVSILILLALLPAVYPVVVELSKHNYAEAFELFSIALYIDFGIIVGTVYTRKLLKGDSK